MDISVKAFEAQERVPGKDGDLNKINMHLWNEIIMSYYEITMCDWIYSVMRMPRIEI